MQKMLFYRTVSRLSKSLARPFFTNKSFSSSSVTNISHQQEDVDEILSPRWHGPTLLEIEQRIEKTQRIYEKATKNVLECPSCESKVSAKKLFEHLQRCARDLLPKDGTEWPCAVVGCALAKRQEDRFRATVIDLRFGETRRTIREVGNITKTPITRVKRAIRKTSRSIPLVIDPPGDVLDLDILFEDQDIIVVNKPPHITHHPKHRWQGGTLLNSVLGWVQQQGGDPTTVGPATRLDRDTTGVSVFSKTKAAASAVGQLMSAPNGIGEYGGSIKEYLALTEPLPSISGDEDYHFNGRSRMPQELNVGEEFVVRKSLAAGPKRKNAPPLVTVVPVFDGGKPAGTRCQLLGVSPLGHELLLCTLESGRTHQIRVHLQSAGRSVLGDTTYGSLANDGDVEELGDEKDWTLRSLHCSNGAIGRQALHAWRLRFLHPRSMREMEVTAPVPNDMINAAKMIQVNHPYFGGDG